VGSFKVSCLAELIIADPHPADMALFDFLKTNKGRKWALSNSYVENNIIEVEI
jgi:hypothetical protein